MKIRFLDLHALICNILSYIRSMLMLMAFALLHYAVGGWNILLAYWIKVPCYVSFFWNKFLIKNELYIKKDCFQDTSEVWLIWILIL